MATVGGPAKSLLEPISEADFPNPLTNYAKSKLKAEEYIINYKDSIVLILGFLNGIKAKIVNKPEIFSYEKAIDFTQNYWICDTTKAREQINLKTDRKIEDLLKKTADWYMQNGWIK